MVRMSDILKKAKEREKKARDEKSSPIEPAHQEMSPEPVKLAEEVMAPEVETHKVEKSEVEQQPEIKEQEKEKAESSEVRISSVVMKGAKIVSNEESLKLYEESVSLMRKILKENVNYEAIDAEQIKELVEKIINQLDLGNERILRLALVRDSKDENYLFCHSANVCIFAIEIGLGLNYEKSELTELGISALFHDIGMVDYLHLSDLPRKFITEEHDEIKNHPIRGSEFLEKIKNLGEITIRVAHQQHERIDGSGYPKGLKGEQIHEYAKIVGIVDTFEAMVHRRPYRDKFLAQEVAREILINKSSFERKLMKILIERIGVFPTGSYVELNTREIAEVIKLNHAFSLRPVVEIIYGANSKKLKETKILDLTTQPNIYIRKAVKENELSR